jgi:hypothetical protein
MLVVEVEGHMGLKELAGQAGVEQVQQLELQPLEQTI